MLLGSISVTAPITILFVLFVNLIGFVLVFFLLFVLVLGYGVLYWIVFFSIKSTIPFSKFNLTIYD